MMETNKTQNKTYKLTFKAQNDRKMELDLQPKVSLSELLNIIDEMTKDKEGWEHYTNSNTRLILAGAPPGIALITDKYTPTTTLEEVIGLVDRSVLILALGQPNRDRNRIQAAENNIQSDAYSNLVNIQVLIRNIEACTRGAQRDMEPSTRTRYDHPENLEEIPQQPSK